MLSRFFASSRPLPLPHCKRAGWELETAVTRVPTDPAVSTATRASQRSWWTRTSAPLCMVSLGPRTRSLLSPTHRWFCSEGRGTSAMEAPVPTCVGKCLQSHFILEIPLSSAKNFCAHFTDGAAEPRKWCGTRHTLCPGAGLGLHAQMRSTPNLRLPPHSAWLPRIFFSF